MGGRAARDEARRPPLLPVPRYRFTLLNGATGEVELSALTLLEEQVYLLVENEPGRIILTSAIAELHALPPTRAELALAEIEGKTAAVSDEELQALLEQEKPPT
jgi:hypothetical protein